MRKAQGLPMNVIVIAAIALLVLVVLALIFMGRIGSFGKGVAECANQGGACKADCDPTQGEREYGPAQKACEDKYGIGYVCCIEVGV